MDWKGDGVEEESVVEPEEGSGYVEDPEQSEGHDAVHKINKLKDELEKIKKEKQEYLDGWQRSKADYVNLLKRSEADAKAGKMHGVAKAVETLLPAFDALERAKEHGELPKGFEAIAKQLESAFASLGLEAVGEVGEKFDPALHEALGQDKVESMAEDDTVTAVLEKGYKLGERIIRPAKVRVGHFNS
ncbi:MAG: nucleotide exchange factor GrpE [Minisyncoccia bacterium]